MRSNSQRLNSEGQTEDHSGCLSALGMGDYSVEIQSLCQACIDDLAEQISPMAIWATSRAPDGYGSPITVQRCTAEWELGGRPHYTLLSQQVWHETLPSVAVSETRQQTPWFSYICPYALHPAVPEYVAVVSRVPLSSLERYCVEQRVQVLENQVTRCRERWRVHSQVQLLEQIIRQAEHQLRTPLALLDMHAELLCRGLPSGHLYQNAEAIRDTVRDMGRSLSRLLTCSSTGRHQLALHDIRVILEDSVSSLQPWIEAKQVRVSYPSESLTLAVDRWQLRQVFVNLLSNAVYFSPEGGEIICRWQDFQREALIEICDQGPGLSVDDLKHLFTPFYTCRPEGTGLGLAIAKKLVLDHRGSLWAENIPGGGAQFSLTLPRS